MHTCVKEIKPFGGMLHFKLHTHIKSLIAILGLIISFSTTAQSSIDWGSSTWPNEQITGTVPLSVPAGYKAESVTITVSYNALDGNYATGYPRVDKEIGGGIFGGIDDFSVAFDAIASRPNATSPITIEMVFSSPIKNLSFYISDIDHKSARVDQMHITSDAGDPIGITIVNPPNTTISLITNNNTVRSDITKVDSENNDFGSALVDFGTKTINTVTITYTDFGETDGARGAGFFGTFSVISASTITAVADIGSSVTEDTGGQVLSNVLSNDVFQTGTATTANTTLTQVSATHPGITLNTSTGAVNVSSAVPAGDHILEYQICEPSLPTNCSIGTVTIKVLVNNLGDFDGDGIANKDDLDDDNDGILDSEEGCTPISVTGANGFSASEIIFEAKDPSRAIDGNDGNKAQLKNTNATLGVVLRSGNAIVSAGTVVTIRSKTKKLDAGNKMFVTESTDGITFVNEQVYTFATNGDYYNKAYTLSTDATQIRIRYEQGNDKLEIGNISYPDFVIPCIALDTDKDGVPDYRDLDSDNDGITDVIEAGGTDANRDGKADGAVGSAPTTNGVPGTAGTGTSPTSTDTDNIPDYLDIDSDDDGIPDNIEGQPSGTYAAPTGIARSFTDANFNGVDDNFENGALIGFDPPNTDSTLDSIPDYLDLDSDGDAINDIVENGDADNALSGTDTDGDGLDDAFDDNNDTGITGFTVNDGLGVTNLVTNTSSLETAYGDEDNDFPATGDVDYRDLKDVDNDLVADFYDLDNDNDGILDIIENGNCDISIKEEIDLIFSEDFGTGTTRSMNSNVTNHLYDTDGPIPDGSYAVVSSLNANLEQYNRTNTNSDLDANIDATTGPSGGSSNGRYLAINMINTGDTEFYRQSLTNLINGADYRYRLDLAGLCDNCVDLPIFRLEIQDPNNGNAVLQSITSSAIGVLNDDIWIRVVLNFTASTTALDVVIINNQPNGAAGNDVGVDNIVFGLLQCPAELIDTDKDGIVNSLDLDSDNDGIPDVIEAGGTDANNDGIADGVVDTNGVPGSASGGNTPTSTDADGIPNYLDIDSDNDGIPDNIEGQPSLTYVSPSGVGTAMTDNNNNGLDDVYEVGIIIGLVPPNTDSTNDAIPDYLDLDSDNDFVTDILENGDPQLVALGTDADGDGLDDAFDDNDDSGITGFTVNDGLGTGANQKITNTTTLEAAYGDEDADFPATGDVDYRDIRDADKDGVADYYDLDDDNDGVLDTDENGVNFADGDEDGDGIPNYRDTSDLDPGGNVDGSTTSYTDSNGDGIPDVYDNDGDGVPNHLDLDSDNDGIPDLVEAGGEDTDGNGKIDDINANGTLINDTDNDGLDDRYDASNGGNSIANPDTDGDGIPDTQDLDADNDGIPDVVEAGGTDVNGDGKADGFVDTDGDGFNDIVDGDVGQDGTSENTANALIVTGNDANNDGKPDSYPNGDTDQDGIPNHADLDADNDGIPDVVEAGGTDVNGDGRADDFVDADLDGFNDVVDGDPTNALAAGTDTAGANTSNVLIVTGADTNADGNPNSYPNGDTDQDGIPNHLDLDADNDGIPDVVEAGGTDVNGDGRADGFVDADNDGFNDIVDGDPTNALAVGTDTAGANTSDALIVTGADTNGDGNPNSYPNGDADKDGIPNHLDLDADNDGIPDVVEVGGTDVNGDGRADGFIDADNDGFNDIVDGDPTNALATGTDTVGANTSDALIVTGADTNGDGNPNSYPNGDADKDGIPNHLDLDADNDGIPDVVEAGGTDVNGDGRADGFVDADNDGFNDIVDGDPTNALAAGIDTAGANTSDALIVTGADTNGDGNPNSYPNGDADQDGILNIADLDADNDGIPDVVEAGGTDANGDGRTDDFIDADNDGFNDIIDGDPTNALAVGTDTVGANTSNALIVTGTDTNGDGKPNSIPTADTDGDEIRDYLDLDSDNDGILDVIEAGGTDANRDGLLDSFVDADTDGFNDVVDGDPTNALAAGTDTAGANTANALIVTGADTDGIKDGNPNSYPNGDLDTDGKLNYLDIDSDNDGIPDNIEGQSSGTFITPSGVGAAITDVNNNGVDDNYENVAILGFVPPNTDSTNDTIPDYLDLDSDNDGITDILENGDPQLVISGIDTDGDGLDDAFDDNDDSAITGFTVNDGLGNGNKITNTTSLETALGDEDADFPGIGDVDYRDIFDTDKDGIADNVDIDDDNDGILDINETGGNEPNGDEDGDGIPNYRDNSDAGDAGDSSTTNYTDTNADGIPDVYDTDSDGVPNHLDLDADNDGIPDNIEAQSTRDYISPSGLDTDMDGLDNAYDTTPSGTKDGAGSIGISSVNTDEAATVGADLIPDFLDLDSDGDGVFDIVESGSGLTDTAGGADGKTDGTVGTNGLDNILDNGDNYTDVNGSFDDTQTNNFTDTDADVLTIGDVDYRDATDDGIPMITQVYQFGTKRWIEITNIHETKSIAANLIKIQLYQDKTGDQTSVTPDVLYTVTTVLAPGKSILIKNAANTITNIDGTATVIENNTLTAIEGANDIITLSSLTNATSWANRYDVINNFANNTSYVRIDETLLPNTTYTASEWVVFINDALDPYRLLGAGGSERHPHDPLISEIESSNSEANTLLGLHRINITTRTGAAWSNGFPDRSRFVVIDEDYNHTSSRLSARKLTVNATKKLSITDNLIVVTNNVLLNGDLRLVNPAMNSAAQLIQTHTSATLVTGTGKLLVDQNSTVPSIYRYNYIGSPVKPTTGATTYTVDEVLKDGTVQTSHTGTIGVDIAKNINWVSGFDGDTTDPISLADYWIYTYAASGGTRASYVQQFKNGAIPITDGFIFKGPGRAQNYTFAGIPKDGQLTTSVGANESYLVANPYASSISVKEFIEDNISSISGTLYFWEHASEKFSSPSSTAGHNFRGYLGGYATRTITMGVTAKNAAGGAIDTNFRAENALITGGTIEVVTDNAQNINIVTLNQVDELLTFKNIASGVDTLRIRYKSPVDKIIRIKENNAIRTDVLLPASVSAFSIAEIYVCVVIGSDITFESIDANEIQIDYLNLKDDGDITCAPNTGGNELTYTEPEAYIAIGQGFFLQGDETGGAVEFNNSQREYKLEGTESVFFKSSVTSDDPESIFNIPVIKIGMDFNSADDGNNYHRQIGVSFSQYNSFNYDKGYDAEIYDIGNTDFYWKFPSDDKKYVIAGVQSISSDLEIPIEISMGYSGTVSIAVDEMKNITGDVYITDKLNSISYEIINGKANLTLDTGTYTNRFVLAFTPGKSLSVENDDIVNSYTTIYVDNKQHKLVISKSLEININDVEIYNILGKKINFWKIREQKNSYQLDIKKYIPAGIYIVRMSTNKGEINKKIVIE